MRRQLLELLRSPRAALSFARSLRSTHSQYGEDQIFRLLLQPGPQGVYVDVGSHHPVDGSNTYHLYRRGWRGLTIDPNPAFSAAYRRYRPDEPHLVEGVASRACELTYFEFGDSRLGTLSRERAEWLQRTGHALVAEQAVPCRPLRDVIAEHLAGRQIDLLSVDCEGLDEEVLASLDLAVNRPTAILLEDFDRFRAFRDGAGRSAVHRLVADHGYRPIAQLAFSALYVAVDWRKLFALSPAYDERRVQGGILP